MRACARQHGCSEFEFAHACLHVSLSVRVRVCVRMCGCVCVVCAYTVCVCVCMCVFVCMYPQHHGNRLAVADKTGAGVAASRGPSAPGHSSATSGHQHPTTLRGGKESYFASPSWESSVDSGMTTVESSPVALHQRAADLASILEVCTRYLDLKP